MMLLAHNEVLQLSHSFFYTVAYKKQPISALGLRTRQTVDQWISLRIPSQPLFGYIPAHCLL